MKLHLGCGIRDFGSDWHHIDMEDHPHVKSHSITKLPYSDKSVSIIYASHVLEYFDRIGVLDVLDEWNRVLKTGGVLRIAVPNFEVLAEMYHNREIKLSQALGPIFGKWGSEVDKVYHRTTYDFESLSKILSFCGFYDAKFWDWRDTEHAHIDDHSQAYIPHMEKDTGRLISLNVEAYCGDV